MGIKLKTPEQIEGMRVAGRLAAEVLEMIGEHIVKGVTTEELDRICHEHIVKVQGGYPATLNYGGQPYPMELSEQGTPTHSFHPEGFPKSICTSVNDVVCHGIPNKKPLKNGDILNLDVTVIKNGFHGDTSKMFVVGEATNQAKKLIQVTQESLYLAIDMVKPGARLGDIGYALQKYVEKHGYSVVREYCGHGIGEVFHEEPQVTHYGRPGTGVELQAGMTFTIEPMVNFGKRNVKLNRKDGWTVNTKDRSLSAQWEHTLLCTKTGVEVLTKRQEEHF
ncbi:type I methionyl aminopeptidase [Kangiella sp. HZ709]|uniref:type I methionyl aminopeptidase n=1 Tax=Kangiella sp. HZ709 TaxID=2666328 RepID=UPI0012AFB40C|nr:type I methionyl aminopeptidase [Kangiella sp. HZ709]MRX28342.1 type I methionyl aminopeptidase [Kangiella sp. HZ709]